MHCSFAGGFWCNGLLVSDADVLYCLFFVDMFLLLLLLLSILPTVGHGIVHRPALLVPHSPHGERKKDC